MDPAQLKAAAAASGATSDAACDVKRPVVMFNRCQEDWSVLVNPCVPRALLDGLKWVTPLDGGSS